MIFEYGIPSTSCFELAWRFVSKSRIRSDLENHYEFYRSIGFHVYYRTRLPS